MFQFPTPAGFANGETALEPQFDSEAAADLWGAAQLLRKHGHIKNFTRLSTGQMCLGGAIAVHICGDATGWGGDRFNNAVSLLGEAIPAGPGRKTSSRESPLDITTKRLVEWNNADERLASEVIDALEQTAAAHALPPAAPAG